MTAQSPAVDEDVRSDRLVENPTGGYNASKSEILQPSFFKTAKAMQDARSNGQKEPESMIK